MAKNVFKPTEEQQSIIDYRGGHLQVIACAGSGKTESVSRRVLSLSSVVSIAHSGVSGQVFPLAQHPDKQAQKEKRRARENVPEAQPLRDDPRLHGRGSGHFPELQGRMWPDEVVMAHQQRHIAVKMIPIPGMARGGKRLVGDV